MKLPLVGHAISLVLRSLCPFQRVDLEVRTPLSPPFYLISILVKKKEAFPVHNSKKKTDLDFRKEAGVIQIERNLALKF